MKRPRLGLTSLTHTMRILIQWGFPRMGVPKNGFCLRENPIKMDINGWFGAWGYPHFRKPPNQTYAKHQFAESQRGSKRRRKKQAHTTPAEGFHVHYICMTHMTLRKRTLASYSIHSSIHWNGWICNISQHRSGWMNIYWRKSRSAMRMHRQMIPYVIYIYIHVCVCHVKCIHYIT